MIVVNNDVQVFSSDARRHNVCINSDQFDSQHVCHKYNYEMSGGVSDIEVRTRCFYNSDVDKKQVQGLLARGRKALLVTDHLKSSVAENSKTRVRRFKPITSVVSGVSHPISANNVESSYRASVTGALDGFPTPQERIPTSIVTTNNLTRTSGDNNGELIGGSVNNYDNKGVKPHTQSLNDAMCHKSKDVNYSQNGSLWSTKAKVSQLIDESIHETTSATVGQSTRVQGNKGQPPPNQTHDQYALIYDVNMDQNGFGNELCNALFFKNGWKNMSNT